MTEQDFIHHCKKYFSVIHAPKDLKNRTLALIASNAHDEICNEHSSSISDLIDDGQLKERSLSSSIANTKRTHPTKRSIKRRNTYHQRSKPQDFDAQSGLNYHSKSIHSRVKNKGRITAVAACFAVAAAGLALGLASENMSWIEPRFSITAYAASSTQGPIPPQEDGLILFPQDINAPYAPMSWLDTEIPDTPNKQGYTGALFGIDAKDFSRLQATLSEGLIYEYSLETVRMAEDSERIHEAQSWNNATSETSGRYSGYDYVSCVEADDGIDTNDPDKTYQIRLYKILGKTINLSSLDIAECCLGIWESPLKAENAGYIDFAGLNGETLTVTIEFDDGSCQTQTIELHDGWFKATPSNMEDARGGDVVPQGHPLKNSEGLSYEAASERENDGIVYTLYGQTTSIINEPHPYSLENANEYQFAKPNYDDPELRIPSQGATKTRKTSLNTSQLHMKNEAVALPLGAGSEYYWQLSEAAGPVTLTNFESRTTKTISNLTPAQSLVSRITDEEDLTRFNAENRNLYGVEISKGGELSDGFSYVSIEFDLTNCSDNALPIGYGAFGGLCSLSRDLSAINFSTIKTAIAYSVGNDATVDFDSDPLMLSVNEVIHMSAIYIVPDDIAYSDCLLYSTSGLGNQAAVNRVDFANPNEQFVILGSSNPFI